MWHKCEYCGGPVSATGRHEPNDDQAQRDAAALAKLTEWTQALWAVARAAKAVRAGITVGNTHNRDVAFIVDPLKARAAVDALDVTLGQLAVLDGGAGQEG